MPLKRTSRVSGFTTVNTCPANGHATHCLGVHFMVGLDLNVPTSEVVCGVFE
jgi:hypothetical protein